MQNDYFIFYNKIEKKNFVSKNMKILKLKSQKIRNLIFVFIQIGFNSGKQSECGEDFTMGLSLRDSSIPTFGKK